MNTVNVPTQMLEILKDSLGANYYNNQIDATMSNVHFKMRINSLASRGFKFTQYTDGKNELIVIGDVNPKQYTGVSILTK